VLLTGPFGGLTDDVREFLLRLADEGPPVTGCPVAAPEATAGTASPWPGTAPALVAAAAMSGPEPPDSSPRPPRTSR
jgi:hypothetical protein